MFIFGVVEISDNKKNAVSVLTGLNEFGQVTGKHKSFLLALDHLGGKTAGILAISPWESQKKLREV